LLMFAVGCALGTSPLLLVVIARTRSGHT
jgi:hypothetical protein